MRRSLSALPLVTAAAVLMSGSPASAQARSIESACPPGLPWSFADVDPAGTHSLAIDCMSHWQVTAGTAGGGYAPTQGVTRAQMATFISRVVLESGGDLPSDPDDAFDDDDGSPHESAIDALAAAGLVGGKGPRSYAPDVLVTRDQMATFLVRAFEYRAGSALPAGTDAFDDDDDSVHEANIDRAADVGFATGTGVRRYVPAGTVRRDQMASFMSRVLGKLVEDGHSTPPAPPPSFTPGAYGAVTVGMHPDDVHRLMTAAGLFVVEDYTTEHCRVQAYTSSATGPVDLLYSTEDDTLQFLGMGRYWGEEGFPGRSRSAEGIGLRSTEAQVVSAYPDAERRRFDVMGLDSGTGYLVDGGDGRALGFVADDAGRVVGMAAGASIVFEQTEFCA